MRFSYAPLLVAGLTFAGCSSEDPGPDGGAGQDAAVGDQGLGDGRPATDLGTLDAAPDVGPDADSGLTQDVGADGGPVEDGGGPQEDAGAIDSGPGDSGAPLVLELEPGSHVTFASGRINVMSDDYSDVVALLGPGSRGTGIGARTYAFTIDGAEVAIWFANSNLDNDDVPPNDVDATDRVLWIAVSGGYAGRTPANIGVTSSRAEVEAAYGPAPHEEPIAAPMTGTLAQYYTRGLLVAYDPNNAARTITISRAYPLEPNAEIDVQGGRLRFPGFDLTGYGGGINFGTSKNTVTNRLGVPDGEGRANLGGQNLDVYSYAFIGIEVFFLSGTNNTLFLNVHAPFYGTTGSGLGIGALRTDFESDLSGRGYGAAQASGTAQLFCYQGGGDDPDVGVTYSADTPAVVSSITTPLLACP